MHSMPWKHFRRRNDVSLSVRAPIKATSLNLQCAISERDCQRIARTKFSITSFPRSKKEWAWVSPLFDQLLRRTAARLAARTLLTAARAWLFAFLQLAGKCKKARRQHERIR